jgi:hypothetical protein
VLQEEVDLAKQSASYFLLGLPRERESTLTRVFQAANGNGNFVLQELSWKLLTLAAAGLRGLKIRLAACVGPIDAGPPTRASRTRQRP